MAKATCTFTKTLGTFPAGKTGGFNAYSKWVTSGAVRPYGPAPPAPPPACTPDHRAKCSNACAAAAGTPFAMGGIHPRSKKPVGDRLGTAAFNTVYAYVCKTREARARSAKA